MRLSNLSAAVIRPQLPHLARRVEDGRRNHDHVAALLERSPNIHVPAPLNGEVRAPDSIQFNLVDLSDTEVSNFVADAAANGVKVQVFGTSADNARAFWNWQFRGDLPDLPQTRAMLMRACDVRLPARRSLAECDLVAGAITEAAGDVMGPARAVA